MRSAADVVALQARHAVGLHAAQVGADQHVGHDGGFVRRDAVGRQNALHQVRGGAGAA